jgi:hydrogenase maturation protein HypF
MELEALADPAAEGVYPLAIAGHAPAVLDPAPMIRAIVADLRAGLRAPTVAGRFHRTLAAAIAELCGGIRAATGLRRVVLSGGVFQNVTLLAGARRALAPASRSSATT